MDRTGWVDPLASIHIDDRVHVADRETHPARDQAIVANGDIPASCAAMEASPTKAVCSPTISFEAASR